MKKKAVKPNGGDVRRIKEFSRVYMPAVELFGGSYMQSDPSATEIRVLLEIYANDGCRAVGIARNLNLDKSHISMIVRKHIKDGFVVRKQSVDDRRAFELHLTQKGITRAEVYISQTKESVFKNIGELSEENYTALIDAFETIIRIMKSV